MLFVKKKKKFKQYIPSEEKVRKMKVPKAYSFRGTRRILFNNEYFLMQTIYYQKSIRLFIKIYQEKKTFPNNNDQS